MLIRLYITSTEVCSKKKIILRMYMNIPPIIANRNAFSKVNFFSSFFLCFITKSKRNPSASPDSLSHVSKNRLTS